jgi:dTDP-4-amino-4,6-dideoxygalactose transaminase
LDAKGGLSGYSFLEQEFITIDDVLSSGRINYHTGDKTKEFETAFAHYVGAPFALAVTNGTVALEIALCSWGVEPGDEVIVPSRTFIATAGAVVAVGAIPVIADIDPDTNCMTAETCKKVLTYRTRAIIPVHLGGYPAPMVELEELADKVGVAVIEDCAQALGAKYRNVLVGSNSAAGCFSFCQDKILPLGEGGMITYTDEDAYKRAWAFRDHGRSWDSAHEATVGAASARFQWLNDSFGTNARMTEIQGAMGLVALAELEAWLNQRAINAQVLIDAMADLPAINPIVIPRERADCCRQAYYRLYARIDARELASGWSRDRIIDSLNEEGVPVQYGSCALIGNEKAFSNAGIAVNPELAGAHVAHASSIAFFVHPTMTTLDMQDIAATLRRVMADATS